MSTQFNSGVGTAMRRRTLDGLAVFCAVQRYRFDPAAWMRRSAFDCKRVAFAAHYLSMTSWYGHEEELEAIAEKIYPGIASIDTFWQDMQAMDVELAQLSSAVRFGLTPPGRASLPAG
jgi:hypothetical protein